MGLNLDHSILLCSSNLFLDEDLCERKACVPAPCIFCISFLNLTTTINTTHEQALIKRFRLNYIFAFRVFNLDHESAMLHRFRKSRIGKVITTILPTN